MTKKLLLCAKKSQLFLMFPVIKLYLSIHRTNIFFKILKNLKNVKCVIFKTLYNCGKPVRLSNSSMIALLKVYLEFCIYDELKSVNILSPIFEPISRENPVKISKFHSSSSVKRDFYANTAAGMSKST